MKNTPTTALVSIALTMAVIVVTVLGVRHYLASRPSVPTDNWMVACTEEAKMCSDGSYVGRSGPKCEFAPCPSVSSGATTQTGGVLFTTPSLPEYVSLVPPVMVHSLTGDAACSGQRVSIAEKVYCARSESEWAAGSVFKTYHYETLDSKEGQRFSLDVTLRFVQCANYDDAEAKRCQSEQDSFSIDAFAGEILSSAHLAR